MPRQTTSTRSAAAIDTRLTLHDPGRIRERDDVRVTKETKEHEDVEHCCARIAGRVAIAVQNDEGELLLLRNDELGRAILPHGDVEEGEDWAAVAREQCEALTGVSVVHDGVALLREIDHVVESEGKLHRTTSRVVFAARPDGGGIQDCKRSGEAGSDDWWACWASDLPEGTEVPPGGPGDDLRYALDCDCP